MTQKLTQKLTQTLTMVPSLMLSLAAATGVARAETTPAEAARADIQKTVGFMPAFVKAIPDPVLPGLWSQAKTFENAKTALSMKDKKLIGLAVASQAGSRSTTYSYTRCAKANGATDAELGEAVAIAGLARQFSTFMNGVQLDEKKFRAEIAMLISHVTKAASAKGPAPRPVAVVDSRTAVQEVAQLFGFVPEFIQKMPPEAVTGAWLQMRDLEMNPKTALPGKTKTLIGLAVSSQIPCRYCIIADTEFAKLEGASDKEISEAVMMAGVARNFGTLIDGLLVDEATFRRDFDRLTPGADKGAAVARKSK